jgi:hypothetical protein
MMTIQRALRRRLDRVRNGDAQGGIVLPFVIMITLLVVILATTLAMLTIGKVRPTSKSVNGAAATAAAQAGTEAFTAWINLNCTQPGRCNAINSVAVAGQLAGTDGAGTATYTWQVLNAGSYVVDQFLRVQAIGTSRGVSKVLISDFQGTPNLLDFAYYTEYETTSAADVLKQYGPRTIQVTDAAVAALAQPVLTNNTAVTWAGAKTTAMTGANPATSVDICDRRYYDTVVSAATVQGRSNLRSKLPRNGDWAETSTGSTYTHNGQCEIAFGSAASFIGPVYSLDALLLSNGTPGGAGPRFDSSVSSAWAPSSNPPSPLGAPWRSQISPIGGTPTGLYKPTTVNYQLLLPSQVTAATFPAGNGTCVYTGPTRIVIDGVYAVVTSPQSVITFGTPCNPNADPAIAGSPGVAGARIPLSYLKIAYVANGADTTTQVSGKNAITPTNSVFSLTSPVTAPVSTLPVAGPVTTDAAKLFTGTGLLSCALLGSAEDRFTCETGKTVVQLQTLTQTAAVANTALNVQTFVQGLLPAATATLRYVAQAAVPTTAGPTAGSPSDTATGASADTLYTTSAGKTTTTAITNVNSSAVTVVRQSYDCLLVVCAWSSLDPQLTLKVNRASTYTTTTTTPATATFPKAGDVTLYAKYAGDAYVEGTLTGKLSVVAAHDIVTTGNIKDSSASGTTSTTDGLAMVANNDIRVYHPVRCTTVEAITSAGYCANDITGTYTGGIVNYAKHPSQQYISMSRDGDVTGSADVLTTPTFGVTAAMFALSGSVTVDNFDRGAALGALTFTGGVYQRHHGPTGAQWELPAGSAVRDRSGYLVAYAYADIGLRSLPYLPSTSTAVVGRIWNLISTSSASAAVVVS